MGMACEYCLWSTWRSQWYHDQHDDDHRRRTDYLSKGKLPPELIPFKSYAGQDSSGQDTLP